MIDLPVCRHRGRPLTGVYVECFSNRLIGDRASIEFCATCIYADKPNVELPTRLPPGLDCIHRGDVVGTVPCELCGDRGRLKDVHDCALHGKCTHRRYKHGNQPERICFGCQDIEAPD